MSRSLTSQNNNKKKVLNISYALRIQSVVGGSTGRFEITKKRAASVFFFILLNPSHEYGTIT